MTATVERELARVAAEASELDRSLVEYLLTRFCPRLARKHAPSLFNGTNPVALRRADIVAGRLARGSHLVTLKIDGEAFQLLQVPRAYHRLAESAGVDALRDRIGSKREREHAAAPTATQNVTSNAAPNTAERSGGDGVTSSRERTPGADTDDGDNRPRVYLIGRGDSRDRSRLFVLPSGLVDIEPPHQQRERAGAAAAPGTSGIILLDGELALQRYVADRESGAFERERQATARSFAWANVGPKPADAVATADDGVQRRLVFVVHDCLYAVRNYTGALPSWKRHATAKILLYGNDPQRPWPLRLGDRARFDVLYKPHASARLAPLLVRAIDPALVGFACDGLVLTPESGAFTVGTDARLFKLKPPRLQTLDLRVAFVPPASPTAMILLCARDDECSATNSSGRCAREAEHSLGTCDRADFRALADAAAALESNTIVEFAPAPADDDGRGPVRWHPVRVRADKTRPNARRTIEGTLESLRDAVSYDDVFDVLAGRRRA